MMNEPEMTKIISGIENLLDRYSDAEALNILRNDFEFTDDEIREIGLDYLLPKDLSETKEPPKKTFRIHIVETWGGYFDVEASDEEEAYDRAGDIEYDSDVLSCEDREYFVYEA